MPPEARLAGLILLLVYPTGLGAQTEFSTGIVSNSPDTPARQPDPFPWINTRRPDPPSPTESPAERLHRANSQPSRFLRGNRLSAVPDDLPNQAVLPAVYATGPETSGLVSSTGYPAKRPNAENLDAIGHQPEAQARQSGSENPDAVTHQPEAQARQGNTENLDAQNPPTRTSSPYPPLLPRDSGDSSSAAESSDQLGGITSLLTVGGSLAFVLGLFMMMAWIMRRTVPGAVRALPGEVVEVLGRAPLAGRQQVHLVRCGCKLILVSVTPEGAETLTEITDPQEVDRLAGLCRATHAESATNAFRNVFAQLARPRTDSKTEVDSGELDLSGMGFVESTSRGAREQR